MNKIILWFIALVALAMLAFGIYMLYQGLQLSVYTELDAPNLVLKQIQEFSYTEQASAWHAALGAYETPHKKLVDTGESWVVLGLGILMALFVYIFIDKGVSIVKFMSLWAGACLLQIPLIVRYYVMRLERFDYHPSINSVMMPIINESFLVLVGLALCVTIIYFALKKHQLSNSLKLNEVNPTRLMLMGLWLFLLLISIVLAFQDAKLGTILSCTLIIPMVYKMMLAKPKSSQVKK